MAAVHEPRLVRALTGSKTIIVSPVKKTLLTLGHQLTFLFQAITAMPYTARHYPHELLRILRNVSWGNGALIVGGGTIGVIVLLAAFVGATVGIEGYTALDLLGMGSLTGAVSAFGVTRELAPLIAAIGFAAQAGCRFTAELGSMRIAEEIDALEALAINPKPYLISTRIMAAGIAILPLYLLALAAAYLTSQVIVVLLSGQSPGTYQHYFYSFMAAQDVLYSVGKAVLFVVITTVIQCYYGFYATGGPEGVGAAAGRAIRASIIAIIVANTILTLALWGADPGVRLSG